jgi:hypothetical protein
VLVQYMQPLDSLVLIAAACCHQAAVSIACKSPNGHCDSVAKLHNPPCETNRGFGCASMPAVHLTHQARVRPCPRPCHTQDPLQVNIVCKHT